MPPRTATAASNPPGRPAPRLAIVFGGLAAASLAALASGQARGEEALRWKLKPGDVLRFTMAQDTTNSFKRGPGFESSVLMSQVVDLHWKVKSLSDDGEAEVAQAVDRIRFRIDGAGEPSAYDFDSDADAKRPPPPDGPIALQLSPLLKALVHAEFTFKTTSRGEIRDVKVPENLMVLVRQANPAGGGTVFSDEGIKNLVTLVGLPVPETSLRRGESWTRRSKLPLPSLGAMTIDRTFTVEGEDDATGRVRLALASTMAIEPDPAFGVKVKIDRQQGKGVFMFDAGLGRLASSHVEEELVMTLSNATQSVGQSTRTVTDVKRVDEPSSR